MERIKTLIEKYGTPIYLYNRDIIEQHYDTLKDCLLKNANIYYSMKANPLIGICKVLLQKGSGLEVASKAEIYTGIKAGYDPKKIVFAGPGKTEDDIAYAIDQGIKTINAECMDEILLINEYSKKKHVVTDIALRINPSITNKGALIKMTGTSSQFGIEESIIDESFLLRIIKLQNVKIVGIQVYMGTMFLDANEICDNTKNIIELAIRLRNLFGLNISYIDFGGGFGVPYFPNHQPLDMNVLKEGMAKIDAQYSEFLSNIEIIFESGRYLVAESGVFATKVLYYKESREQKYLICDGGSNLHSASAFLGQFMRNNYPVTTIPEGTIKVDMNVVGPLCTPTDVIGKKVAINQDIKPGDYVLIKMSGAYGLTDSPLLFLSHEWPVELLYNDNYEEIIRRRGTTEDLLFGQEA